MLKYNLLFKIKINYYVYMIEHMLYIIKLYFNSPIIINLFLIFYKSLKFFFPEYHISSYNLNGEISFD